MTISSSIGHNIKSWICGNGLKDLAWSARWCGGAGWPPAAAAAPPPPPPRPARSCAGAAATAGPAGATSAAGARGRRQGGSWQPGRGRGRGLICLFWTISERWLGPTFCALTVLYCAVLYCTVLCCTVLYCAVLCCTVLYCTVLYHNFRRFVKERLWHGDNTSGQLKRPCTAPPGFSIPTLTFMLNLEGMFLWVRADIVRSAIVHRESSWWRNFHFHSENLT